MSSFGGIVLSRLFLFLISCIALSIATPIWGVYACAAMADQYRIRRFHDIEFIVKLDKKSDSYKLHMF